MRKTMMVRNPTTVSDEKRQNKAVPKSFLDTSAVYKSQLGMTRTRKWMASAIPQPWYINNYVQMEFFRQNVVHWIYLYFESEHEKYETFGDVYKFYSQGFGREAKNAVAVLTTIEMDGVSFAKADHKQLCREKLQDFIYLMALQFSEVFTDMGADPTGCSRIKSKLRIPNDAGERVGQLLSFGTHFRDEKACRQKCSISRLFTNASHVAKMESILAAMADGDTGEKLQNIKQAIEKCRNAPAKITCKRCAKMGDAVVAVALDSSWKLHSFDAVHQPIAASLGLESETHPSEQGLDKLVEGKSLS
jgi:hypothetical protein